MADPISVAAIAGLIYAGRKLSQPVERYEQPPVQATNEVFTPDIQEAPAPLKEYPLEQPYINKGVVSNFGDIAPQQKSAGGEILNMRNRMYDTGRMNNLSPIEKRLVGPGLGVDPNVESYGGYQQLLRVNPENVGAYRLTTLPGRSGPAYDSKGGRRGRVGLVSHNRPEKTAFLPERLPVTFGRAQGMSGRTPRGEHEKTKRTTNRSETGLRTDTLSVAPAKRIVSGQTLPQDPTRNKKDGNIEQYAYRNQPQPGIHSFRHGYLESPAVAIGEKRTYASPHTVEELNKYGFRPDERRGKANRMSAPGRMNVRADALNQGGMLTNVRLDTTRVDGRVNPQNGAWTQQYTNDSYHDFNPHKGNANPYASNSSLNVAKRQLLNNPLAHHIS
jgi:hypothetical protein